MNDLAPQPAEPAPRVPPERTDAPPDLSRDASALARLLARVRWRAASIEAARAVLFGAAAALGVLLAAVALLALKQEWARVAGWALAGAAVLVGVGFAIYRARRVGRDDVAAARALGRAAPKHASDLVSAVQLIREPPDGASLAFVRAHLDRMAHVSASLDLRGTLPLKPLAYAVGALALACALHATLARVGGKKLGEAYAYLTFDAAAAQTPLFAPEPIAGDVALTYRYPVHMNRMPRTVAGTAGDIGAPKGTVVEITARADRDVARAFAVVGKDELPLRVKGREVSVGSSRVDLQACKLEYSIVSPK